MIFKTHFDASLAASITSVSFNSILVVRIMFTLCSAMASASAREARYARQEETIESLQVWGKRLCDRMPSFLSKIMPECIFSTARVQLSTGRAAQRVTAAA